MIEATKILLLQPLPRISDLLNALHVSIFEDSAPQIESLNSRIRSIATRSKVHPCLNHLES